MLLNVLTSSHISWKSSFHLNDNLVKLIILCFKNYKFFIEKLGYKMEQFNIIPYIDPVIINILI
jgi:hypothetical protein